MCQLSSYEFDPYGRVHFATSVSCYEMCNVGVGDIDQYHITDKYCGVTKYPLNMYKLPLYQ